MTTFFKTRLVSFCSFLSLGASLDEIDSKNLQSFIIVLVLLAFPIVEPIAFASSCSTSSERAVVINLVYKVVPAFGVEPLTDGGGLSNGKSKVLLIHYMSWYETPAVRGQWGAHWTGHNKEHNPDTIKENGLPDIWSRYHPIIGLYDSTDSEVLECQLLQMKLAGVNGVIVDWYGTYPAADYPAIHAATRAMFDACGKLGMKFAACYEDRSLELLVKLGKISPSEIPDQLGENLNWAAAEWFSAPQYFQFEGHPLLLNFGPIYVKDKEPWSAAVEDCDPRPAFFALHHLWQDVDADGGFSWVHTEPFDGEPGEEVIVQRLTETHNFRSSDPLKSIPSVYPGFEDVYETSLLNLGRREGRTMRETLRAAMEGPWPLVQLVTWNDYGEGTVIEPTHEDGYAALEAIQDARRKELGDSFTFTADDLRLPAKLLKLRKQRGADTANLEKISALLANGHPAEAKKMLEEFTVDEKD